MRRRRISITTAFPDLKDAAYELIVGEGLPRPERDKQFHPTRRWRADLIWWQEQVLVEIDGGSFGGRVIVCPNCSGKVYRVTKTGKRVYIRENLRHNSGLGSTSDMEKLNAAALLGFRTFKFSRDHLENGYMLDTLKRVFVTCRGSS